MKQQLLAAILMMVATQGTCQVRPTDFESVKTCKSLGEVEGKFATCSMGSARASAMKKAEKAGATHIVWTNARCVVFVGERATGEMFDCNARPSTEEAQGRPPGPLGLFVELIPQELRGTLKRNTGAYVKAVADRSPAFFANVLPGDVIIRSGTIEVATPEDLNGLKAGDELVILRDGKEMTIQTK